MGSCCSTLSARDVLTMLAAKLPTEPSKHSDRDKLFKKACELHREESGGRECMPASLVQALQELFQTHKISGEIGTVCHHLACPSALRYGAGRLNFKERRQLLARAAAAANGRAEDNAADFALPNQSAVAALPRNDVHRFELRYLLTYMISYFRVKAIFEETAGLRFVTDPRETTIDEFSLRTAKRQLESEFRITLPPGGIAVMYRETAAAAGAAAPKSDAEPIPIAGLVEHLTAVLFYDEMTAEDEPPRQVASRNASAVASPAAAPSLTPVPPKSPPPGHLGGSTTSRGAGRQFGALLQEVEAKEPVVEATPVTADPEEPLPLPPTADSPGGSTKGASSEGGSQPRRRGSERRASRSSSRGNATQPQLPPPPLSGAFGSTASKSSLSMWRSARALIPLGLTDEDGWAREDLFDRFLTHAQKGKSGKMSSIHVLNEMDLYQGVLQHFMLKEIFPNGGLVVSQAVSSAFVAALHRLQPATTNTATTVTAKQRENGRKSEVNASNANSRSGATSPALSTTTGGTGAHQNDGLAAPLHEDNSITNDGDDEEGIRSVSRFHVFLAVLVALMDLHFSLKRRMVKAEADRLIATQHMNAEVLAKQTHQRGPQGAEAPNPLGPPPPPSVSHADNGVDVSSTAVPLYEQNRIYQQTVGPVPLEMFLEVLMLKLVAAPPTAPSSGTDGVAVDPTVDTAEQQQQHASTLVGTITTAGPTADMSGATSTTSSSAFAAFHQISNAPMLPESVLEIPRVGKMIETLVVGIRHSAASTVAGPGGVPRVSLEKVGARIGVFLCDALYLPFIAVDAKKADFLLLPELDTERHQLLMTLNKPSSLSDAAPFTLPSGSQLVVNQQVLAALSEHLQLLDMTEAADTILAMAHSQALEFEHAVRLARDHARFPRNAHDAQNVPDDDNTPRHQSANLQSISDEALLAEPLPWYRFLQRLYVTLTVAVSVESTRQPPLVDLDDFHPVSLDGPITIKEWGHLCRSTFVQSLGLRKLLAAQDHFVIYHGLRRASDEDVVTCRAVCQWASERVFASLSHEARPSRFQWYHVLTQRLPSAYAEADEPRCQSLFVRLTDGRDDAVLPSTHLAGLLGAAFGLHTLFDPADVGSEGIWETICKDAADASDAIAARRPSLVQDDTFRSCLCYLQGSMACYFTAERLLLPPSTATQSDSAATQPPVTSLTTLPVKKDAFAELLRRLQLQESLPTAEAITDEFATLASGNATAELRHVAHFVGIMDLRKLPVRKLDIWKRIGPLLLQLVENDEQRMKFFTFGIQKDHHILHCTALELQRAIGKDWCLDVLLGKTTAVGPLLRDAIGVANSAKYPLPKDTSIVTQDVVAPLLTFLYTYLDVAVATEEHMRAARSRRRSSAAASSSLRVDEAAFLKLDDVFARSGIRFSGTTQAQQGAGSSTSGTFASTPERSRSVASIVDDGVGGPNKAALQRVFEVLRAADGTCSADAIAHWAAHAAVRSRFGLGQPQNAVASPRKASVASSTSRHASVGAAAAAVAAGSPRVYATSHPASPWTQLRAKLPIGTDAKQSQRRSILFQQFDVTRRQSHLTPTELVDGAQWILGLDVFRVDLAAVAHRSAAAAKDALRAHFDGGSDGGMSKVSPQYAKSIKDALASPNVAPLEFRLVLVYLYQYLELYYMFDQLMVASAELDGLLPAATTSPSKKAVEKPAGLDMSTDAKRGLPKHVTYRGFLKGGDALVKWGLDEEAFQEPDVLFRRVNGGRDGVLLFSEFAAWASREQLHVEEPDFGDTVL